MTIETAEEWRSCRLTFDVIRADSLPEAVEMPVLLEVIEGSLKFRGSGGAFGRASGTPAPLATLPILVTVEDTSGTFEYDIVAGQ